VLSENEKLIGTVCYYSPQKASGHPWYDKKNVASFGQFAVMPEYQRFGLGTKLIQFVEELALKDGAKEIAIDTAETANELINYYSKKGYRIVDEAKWEEVNYKSVILSKSLQPVQDKLK
jgi:GNAT superfamily N-acetyltransferase